MKKLILFLGLLLISVAAWCQVADESLKDSLVAIGITPAWSAVIGAVLIVIGKVIPNKWTDIMLYIEKLFYAIYLGLNKINEKTNRLSKSQKIALALKKGASVMLLLLCINITSSAQGSFHNFWKSTKHCIVLDPSAAKLNILTDTTIDYISKWSFKPAATLTAVAIDVSDIKNSLSQSLSSIGLGLRYGNYETVDNTAYCNYSFNALLLTSIKIGETTSTKLGGAITVDVFNNLLGGGIGYINNKLLLLTTISYSF
jgi:hypothetical protein